MCGYLFAFLAIVQMAAFFLFWQVTTRLQIAWIVYLVYWIRNLAQTLVPLLTVTGMLLLKRSGHRRILLFPILPVLSYALYFLPDHYLHYLLEIGLDSTEAVAMGAIVTPIECIGLYLYMLLIYFVARYVYLRATKAKPDESSELSDPLFNLQNPMIKAVFFGSFANFCLQSCIELVRVASVTASIGTYTLEEILTIVISFIMYFAMLLASHVFCMLYLRYARKHYTIQEEETI